jgi:hypothetical protein
VGEVAGVRIVAAAGGVLWLADYVRLLAAPYRTATLALREDPPPLPHQWLPPLPSASKVDQHLETIEDFMQRVMGLDARAYELEDDTTIWDFAPVTSSGRWDDRARLFYGIELSKIEPAYLWAIAERIRASEAMSRTS